MMFFNRMPYFFNLKANDLAASNQLSMPYNATYMDTFKSTSGQLGNCIGLLLLKHFDLSSKSLSISHLLTFASALVIHSPPVSKKQFELLGDSAPYFSKALIFMIGQVLNKAFAKDDEATELLPDMFLRMGLCFLVGVTIGKCMEQISIYPLLMEMHGF